MNYRWVDLLGNFEDIDGGRVFLGREYDGPNAKTDASDKQGESSGPPVDQPAVRQKKRCGSGKAYATKISKKALLRSK